MMLMRIRTIGIITFGGKIMLEENLEIKITSKGLQYFGKLALKNTAKELDLTKQRFNSLAGLLRGLDPAEADSILLYVNQRGIGTVLEAVQAALIELNDNFLEVLREGLIQKRIRTLQDFLDHYEIEPNTITDKIQKAMSPD